MIDVKIFFGTAALATAVLVPSQKSYSLENSHTTFENDYINIVGAMDYNKSVFLEIIQSGVNINEKNDTLDIPYQGTVRVLINSNRKIELELC